MSKKGDLSRWFEREINKDKRELVSHKKQFIKEIQKFSRKELLEQIKTPKKISKWQKIKDKMRSFFHN
jgi:hypothetical protein|tara:strand:+ start:880 stop:1083 length:204 start_codon:yes stop_codon:yes gene_type:complete